MKRLLILVLVGCIIVPALATYGKHNGGKCYPGIRRPCGKTMLIDEKISPCTHCTGYNVCKASRTYTKYYYSYVYKKYCRKGWWYKWHCSYSCVRTDKCDYKKTYTSNEYKCCPGFTTAPSPTDYHHNLYSRSAYYLKKNGCPRAIINTTLQCLKELGLSEFVKALSGLKLETLLDTINSNNFTIFAPTNEVLLSSGLDTLSLKDRETILRSHVVGKLVPAIKLTNGQKIASLNPGRFIHVTEVELKKWNKWRYYYYERIFINGNELIARDACVAVNGIVHIIKGVIDSSNKTVGDIVRESANLTTLETLLKCANLLDDLDKPLPLITLFAPTDQAIETAISDLGLDIVACLKAKPDALKKFLLYHLVCGAEYGTILVELRKQLTTKACKKYHYYRYYYYKKKYYTICKKVSVSVLDDGGIAIGKTGAVITHLDIPASNGLVHYISLPLVNPWLNLPTLCDGFPSKRSFLPPPPPLVYPPP